MTLTPVSSELVSLRCHFVSIRYQFHAPLVNTGSPDYLDPHE